jgi:hypothetical protein
MNIQLSNPPTKFYQPTKSSTYYHLLTYLFTHSPPTYVHTYIFTYILTYLPTHRPTNLPTTKLPLITYANAMEFIHMNVHP